MNIHWDAEAYTRDFAFVPRYGGALLELLEGEGLSVLDLGCGSGALTRALADRGHAPVGLDASPELLALARKQYPDLAFLQGDALHFRTREPFDAVFSNAVLHWIDEDRQPVLLDRVFQALKPGGQFVFECGGSGNNALIHDALAQAFQARGLVYRMPFYFPTVGQYAALLEETGFQVRTALLLDRPTPLKGENGLLDWMRMFVKTPFEGLSPETREAILRDAAGSLEPLLRREGVWYADYVSLRCRALRPK